MAESKANAVSGPTPGKVCRVLQFSSSAAMRLTAHSKVSCDASNERCAISN